MFCRIYDHQDSGFAFTNVEALLRSMSDEFPSQLEMSVREFLKKQDFSDEFIEQLVRAAMRVNYGQEETIQAFVGALTS